jgi:hypothetical protein
MRTLTDHRPRPAWAVAVAATGPSPGQSVARAVAEQCPDRATWKQYLGRFDRQIGQPKVP